MSITDIFYHSYRIISRFREIIKDIHLLKQERFRRERIDYFSKVGRKEMKSDNLPSGRKEYDQFFSRWVFSIKTFVIEQTLCNI